jgi:hypothetical protein
VQEQLLLKSLTSFSALVSKPSNGRNGNGNGGGNGVGVGSFELTWSNPAECESYIKTLQQSAEKLSSENRKLRNVRTSISYNLVPFVFILDRTAS